MIHDLAVFFVVYADLDLVEVVENVQLCHGDGRVAVDHGREAEEGNVEPTATALAASGHAKLVADGLEVVAKILQAKKDVG